MAATPAVRERILRAGSILFALLWLWGAATKVAAPEDAYEFTARLTGGDPPAKATLVAWTALEAGLGVAMLLGGLRGFLPSALLLGAATAALFRVKAMYGGGVRCGCLALLADPSVDSGISRNYALLGVALALLAWAGFSGRDARPGAPAGSGPATDAP